MEWNGLLSCLGLGIRYRMDDGTRFWSSGLHSCKTLIAHKFKLKLKLKAHARHEIDILFNDEGILKQPIGFSVCI
jgi:hypothetical protein